MKSKKTILLLCIIIAALAGTAFYFLYFIRTPAYALNEARLAMQRHDAVKFERYVDVGSVMDAAFEDIIKAESQINNDNLLSNPFAISILHMLKPSVTELLRQEALDRVAGRPVDSGKNADPVPDAMKRNMERHIPLDRLAIRDLQLSKTDKEGATASMVLHNAYLGKDFIAHLHMEVNDKGDWQITRVSNLTDLIIQFDAAKKAKQAAASKPIMERLSKAVQTYEATLSISADSAAAPEQQTILSAAVTAKNMTDVSINRMYYDVLIFDEQGRQLYSYPEHFRGSIGPGQTVELKTGKALNKMLPDDKRLMEYGVDKERCKIQITYIAFDDGNVLSPNTFIE